MIPILEVEHISNSFLSAAGRSLIFHSGMCFQILSKKLRQPKTESFWALSDVSFSVQPGESVGIIGRNGAGKSTLLKILSKITPPTKGRILCRGRIASLLEVGTGFHPELTGRENIFMNGSILGMRRAEINRHFNAIVEFSGVEQFLDTPLKRYSSGMQLRLAFAVAAHLEPEILIIDEVLAVGDAEFQKKCLGKMNEVSKSGRTVIFVSHDMGAIQNLCVNSILLNNGKLVNQGKQTDIIAGYLNNNQLSTAWVQTKEMDAPHFSKLEVLLKGHQPDLVLQIKFTIKSPAEMNPSFVAFDITNKMGNPVGQAIPRITPFIQLNNEEKEFTAEIELNGFVPNDYVLNAWMGPHNTFTYDWQKEITGFTVIDSPQQGRVFPHSPNHGNIVPKSKMIVNG